MKIRYASDLHLEFAYSDPSFIKPKDSDEVKAAAFAAFCDAVFPPQDDDASTTLLLAGDICDNWRAHTRFRGFFARASERFAEVIWLPGNHEYYGGKLSNHHDTRVAMNMANEFGNVFYWNRNRTTYVAASGQKVHVIAATMWTDCKDGCPLVEMAISLRLNDYNHITFADVDRDIYRKLRVSDVRKEHGLSIQYIIDTTNRLKAQDPDCVVVVATHHAPDRKSIPQEFIADDLSYAYAATVDWSAFAIQPDYWVHGHIHETIDYEVSGTRVLANPYGYPGHYHNDAFAVDASITVEDVDV